MVICVQRHTNDSKQTMLLDGIDVGTKTIHIICFQTLCKLNKSTYRLFAPKNLVLTTIFFWCKNSTSALIKFLRSFIMEM